jgi:hypothetical protein
MTTLTVMILGWHYSFALSGISHMDQPETVPGLESRLIVTAFAPPVSIASEFAHFLACRAQSLVSFSPIQGFQAPWPGCALLVRGAFLLQPRLWPPSRWNVSTSIDGWWRIRESFNAVEDCGEQLPSDSHFGKLERHVFRVPRDLRPDLDEILS